MTFQEQVTTIQNMINHFHVFPTSRKMGPYEVQDIYFFIGGVSIYCCVNYTKQQVTWRNKDTGEEIRK